ncbi:LysR family transcriptional regulator [Rhizobium sp. TRM95111]|uniref:LysR family transcriptional regulator n=1 Tax=Rhizobium alarense TaxID=2846851 RepID=UPI001F23EB3A|nr:LysR family transcriptional regulator [Rhizobium alarense]MCF3639815.1 LysR family transcriptional regulator [Rhizobium alarense]
MKSTNNITLWYVVGGVRDPLEDIAVQIDPRHLLQIWAIVDTRGMSEAAAVLGMTQPGLSRTVAYLERRLGEPLFLRNRRPIEPTPLCRDLADLGAAVRRATTRASDVTESFKRGERGDIRIGGTPFFMDALVSAMVGQFQRTRPNVRISQVYGYTAVLAERIRAGQLDLAICPVEVFDTDSDLTFDPILTGRNVVACRANHPLLASDRLQAANLLQYPWIEPPAGSPLSADLRTTLLNLGAEHVRINFSGASLAGILAHLGHSDSLAVLPFGVVFAQRETDGITALPLLPSSVPRALGFLQSKLMPPGPAALQLKMHVLSAFADLKPEMERYALRCGI